MNNPYILTKEEMDVVMERRGRARSPFRNERGFAHVSSSRMIEEAVTIINILMPNLANDSLNISLYANSSGTATRSRKGRRGTLK